MLLRLLGGTVLLMGVVVLLRYGVPDHCSAISDQLHRIQQPILLQTIVLGMCSSNLGSLVAPRGW